MQIASKINMYNCTSYPLRCQQTANLHTPMVVSFRHGTQRPDSHRHIPTPLGLRRCGFESIPDSPWSECVSLSIITFTYILLSGTPAQINILAGPPACLFLFDRITVFLFELRMPHRICSVETVAGVSVAVCWSKLVMSSWS